MNFIKQKKMYFIIAGYVIAVGLIIILLTINNKLKAKSASLETSITSVTADRNAFKVQVDEYQSKVKELEEQLSAKQQELASLTGQTDVPAETQVQQTSSEASAVTAEQTPTVLDVNYYKKLGLTYKGGLTNNIPNGKGALYKEDGKKYLEGTFKDGMASGQGILYADNDKIYYKGELFKNQMHGNGVLYFQNTTKVAYQGEFKDGSMNGEGKEFYPDGKLRYEGSWENGEYSGYGTAYWSTGNKRYAGEWSADKAHGTGTFYLENEKGEPEAEYKNLIFTGGVEKNVWGGLSKRVGHYDGDFYGTEFSSGDKAVKFLIEVGAKRFKPLKILKMMEGDK